MTTSELCKCGKDYGHHVKMRLPFIPTDGSPPIHRPWEQPRPRPFTAVELEMLEAQPDPTFMVPTSSLTEDDALRNELPMFDGLVAYFPNALAEVAKVSKIGNDQHNPGQPLHWARGKSTDHENKIVRHLVDVGRKDKRGVRHSARLAWRALALLQEELEREVGAPMSRGSRAPDADGLDDDIADNVDDLGPRREVRTGRL